MARVVAVCDREADIFDYLHGKVAAGERFVVRARHLRRVLESRADLLQHLQAQAVLGSYRVEVAQTLLDHRGKRQGRPARVARLRRQSASVTFRLQAATLTLNAVRADEMAPPSGVAPLRWLLLTSEPVVTHEQALAVVHGYSARWRIEDFHKAWKSGAGVEDAALPRPVTWSGWRRSTPSRRCVCCSCARASRWRASGACKAGTSAPTPLSPWPVTRC